MPTLQTIYRHPVKGLSPEPLQAVKLTASEAMPHDRIYAVAHARSQVDRADPAWVERRNFLVVAHSPRVVLISSRYDEAADSLHVTTPDDSQSFSLSDQAERQRLARLLEAYAGPTQAPPFEVIRLADGSMTDSPTATLSVLNLASLRALSEMVGEPLDLRRFRGNLWVDIEPAWCENDWVGRKLEIGDVGFRIAERIERCAATNANPATGDYDQNLPRTLLKQTGRADFGCLAEVLESGTIRLGDAMKLT